MQQWSVPGWAVVGVVAAVVVVAGACLLLTVSLRRERARTAQALARAEADAAALRTQLSGIEQELAASQQVGRQVEDREYVITRLGEEAEVRVPQGPAAPVVPAPVFADLVLRETAVQTGAFVAGLRRALSPEVRHRIRFEMRREVKRARKQRKTERRTAVREWQARQRAGVDLDESAA
ncbi:hypothetical protein [Nocardioides nanhaiensis]|uniref:Uncharacterized protein n=1 Tax=Nocardioides nanhaiensis TaxID=1476871 RepID=A0ABP8WJY9_9ACTN